jgi:hypothetical protein
MREIPKALPLLLAVASNSFGVFADDAKTIPAPPKKTDKGHSLPYDLVIPDVRYDDQEKVAGFVSRGDTGLRSGMLQFAFQSGQPRFFPFGCVPLKTTIADKAQAA